MSNAVTKFLSNKVRQNRGIMKWLYFQISKSFHLEDKIKVRTLKPKGILEDAGFFFVCMQHPPLCSSSCSDSVCGHVKQKNDAIMKHVMNFAMSQGTAKRVQCSFLSNPAVFFTKSAEFTKLLDEICQQTLSTVAPTFVFSSL